MTTMPARQTAIHRFEEALTEAAAEFGRRLHRSTDPVRRAADALIARLGFDPAQTGDALMEALRREGARLRRQALRGDPRYDMNRHIAVRRLLAGREPVLPEPAFRETRQPGRTLNNRFRRPDDR